MNALKRLIALALAISLSAAALSGCFHREKKAGTNEQPSVYVKTKDVLGTDLFYYSLNGSGGCSECQPFDPNVNEYYIFDCLALDYNTLAEALQSLGDNIYNAQMQRAAIPETVQRALAALDDFEGRKKHWLWVERAFVSGNMCWLSIAYNVNWHTPYLLLEYNATDNTIKEILNISNEMILGIKTL